MPSLSLSPVVLRILTPVPTTVAQASATENLVHLPPAPSSPFGIVCAGELLHVLVAVSKETPVAWLMATESVFHTPEAVPVLVLLPPAPAASGSVSYVTSSLE